MRYERYRVRVRVTRKETQCMMRATPRIIKKDRFFELMPVMEDRYVTTMKDQKLRMFISYSPELYHEVHAGTILSLLMTKCYSDDERLLDELIEEWTIINNDW